MKIECSIKRILYLYYVQTNVMSQTILKNTRQGSLSGNDGGGSITTIERPSSGSFIMRRAKSIPIKKRLLNKIKINSETGCWEFTGCLSSYGYGRISFKGKTCWAHRVSYIIFIGPIPKGLYVCHKCDNPKCINPNHLFTGTHQDNMDDMVYKGRGKNAPQWENNYRGIPVMAENIKFESYLAASRYVGISDNGIRKRIKRGVFGYKVIHN